ncbi:LAGLIDADG family homing endonuclease [Glycomyces artemisiae]|uniref:LAGLIDADG DNA endonuclease family protein n=1 Tax=Glycomyces artemisiae TaxID=1076443 RepID=A0A2T0UWL4_9ACTN|nr:LAGLIDADG family homing endonuclease [Glycomyces artemisiae]PRY62238.1 hypothetical protein B0I28_101566 [Glycomyces artemisiae]
MFDLTKPEIAYLIGLLQTDGSHHGSLDGKGKVVLELSARDESVLPRLASVLPCYSSIRRRTRDTNFSERYESVALSFFDQEVRRALAATGVPPGRKSRTVAPPPPPIAAADYVRGLLDGDGSVGFTGKGEPFVSLVTASEPLAAFFCDVVQEVCGVTRTARPNRRDGVANIMVLNGAAAKLAAWVWNPPEAIGIDRKREAAIQVAAWTPDPAKAGRYGVARKRWTPEEDRIVLSCTQSEAAALLGRTLQSVSLRKWRLRNGSAGQPKTAQ